MFFKAIAAATLASVACAAQAQSFVTLDGSLDSGARYTNNGHGAAITMSTNGWYMSNRLDFRGQEDLGAGWTTGFTLESGLNSGTGALDNTTGILFNRLSYLKVGSPYGTLFLGHQYSIAHDIARDIDPMYLAYPTLVAAAPSNSGYHFDDGAKYVGDYGPLQVRLENALGGVAGNFADGSARGIGLQYKQGFISAGSGYIHRRILIGATYDSDDFYIAGARMHFGPVMLGGGFMDENLSSTGASAAVRTVNYWAGATYDVDPFLQIGFQAYETSLPNTNGNRDQALFSATYRLSKRTFLYAESDYVRFRGSYVTNTTLNPQKAQRQIGATVGINHTF